MTLEFNYHLNYFSLWPWGREITRHESMIIDGLTIAGILASAMYLLTFVWFGKETIRVDERMADQERRPTRVAGTPCTDC
jgi:uncharacterized membrane protein YccF (DUF307 family)